MSGLRRGFDEGGGEGCEIADCVCMRFGRVNSYSKSFKYFLDVVAKL